MSSLEDRMEDAYIQMLEERQVDWHVRITGYVDVTIKADPDADYEELAEKALVYLDKYTIADFEPYDEVYDVEADRWTT